METKTTAKKTSRKKPAPPKTAKKKAVAAAPRTTKKVMKAAPPKKGGALESIGYAAGATVGTIASFADHATRAIKGAAGKMIHPDGKK